MSDLVDALEYQRDYSTRLVHHPTTTAGGISKRELEQPSCPSCYRPVREKGYCAGCEARGAADRHRRNHAVARAAVAAAVAAERAKPPKWKPGQPRAKPANMISAEQFIAALQAYVAETGVVPSCSRWQREARRPAHHVGYRIFGTWAAALRAAGFEVKG